MFFLMLILHLNESCIMYCQSIMFCCNVIVGGDTSQNNPTVTGGQHSRIANGSSLIEISCTASQGRFLKVGNCKEVMQIYLTY